MMTLKMYNSLTQKSRDEICNALGVYGEVRKPYHHNFDYDALGRRVKHVLECINVQKDGSINVVVNMRVTKETTTPKVAPKAKKAKVVPKAKVVEEEKMRAYYFRAYFEYDPDDGENLWTPAYSLDEARDIIMSDHWGITELVFQYSEEYDR